MKTFAFVAKFIVIPCSSVVGILYAFDMYVIERANTVVEPTRVKVDLISEHSRIHMERVERELLMIRSTQNETNRYLRNR